jgi:hydroxymethylglutaryl-CoA lyase
MKIKIREVAPRDGFQSWPDFVPTPQKLKIIETMISAGVREMETTSFVSPKAIPQMRDAAEVMQSVSHGVCKHTALVPNLKGAQLALDAGADELVVVISSSQEHNMANVKRSIEDSIKDLNVIFETAREKDKPVTVAMAVAFGCPYQGDIPEDDIYRLADTYISGGADQILIADTTGMATPNRVETLVGGYIKRFPDVPFSLHFHNNRGTAMANLLAAIQVGANTFDTALGGIGGCPNVPQAAGNLPTEDVVYMLEEMGCDTGIDLIAIIQAACDLEKILGKTLPGQVMKSGPRDPKLAAQHCNVG